MISDRKIRIVCEDCGYAEVVDPEGEQLPADVVIKHGRETGHTLSSSPTE
jgi:hypothetical protein